MLKKNKWRDLCGVWYACDYLNRISICAKFGVCKIKRRERIKKSQEISKNRRRKINHVAISNAAEKKYLRNKSNSNKR